MKKREEWKEKRSNGNEEKKIGDKEEEDKKRKKIRVGEIEGERKNIGKIRIDLKIGGKIGKIVGIGREKKKREEKGRKDGIEIGEGICGVEKGIERIGGIKKIRVEKGNLGNEERIVSKRKERIERKDNERNEENGSKGNGSEEKERKMVSRDDEKKNKDGRKGGGLKRKRKKMNEIGEVESKRGLRDGIEREFVGEGIILGNKKDKEGKNKEDK